MDGSITFPPFSAGLQLRFWARLQQMRNEYLNEALSKTLDTVSIARIDAELGEYVGNDRLKALAAHSLRGERFFPVPCLLAAKPLLLGYYRLLYGISQKKFYQAPYGRFRSLEDGNVLSAQNNALLPDLCHSLIETGWELLQGVQPVSLGAIHDLQLLTVGPQLRGSENNMIGQEATKDVFELLRGFLRKYLQSETDTVLTIRNAAGRQVQIAFAPDPDITVIERLPTELHPSVSIEIKGGSDASNIHNRLGEAEKSHQKAKATGFTQFWTILRVPVDLEEAQRESPTTTAFFVLDETLRAGAAEHQRFRDRLFQTIGVA